MSPDIDFNPQCEAFVQISLKDVNGRFSYVWADHPASAMHPDVKVGSCDLAGGHDGRCEMFVDGEGSPSRSHWIAWQTPQHLADLATTYEWITRPGSQCCQVQNPAGYHCTRHADHTGGHAFIAAP